MVRAGARRRVIVERHGHDARSVVERDTDRLARRVRGECCRAECCAADDVAVRGVEDDDTARARRAAADDRDVVRAARAESDRVEALAR